MFGFSFSELIVVAVVALVVIGPKDLPKYLRKLGQWAGKLRRMASDLRAQSGIDDALRTEGLADDLNEIRKLARGELDAVQRAASIDGSSYTPATSPSTYGGGNDFYVGRDREYPRDGADAYNALPDNAIVYAEGLPRSKWARDPVYVLADPNGVVPEPEPAGHDAPEPGQEPDHHGASEPAEGEPKVGDPAPPNDMAGDATAEPKAAEERPANEAP